MNCKVADKFVQVCIFAETQFDISLSELVHTPFLIREYERKRRTVMQGLWDGRKHHSGLAVMSSEPILQQLRKKQCGSRSRSLSFNPY